jgi:hypothetical protein
MRRLVVLAGALLPGTGIAQDVQPVFDLPTLAGGQVVSSTAKSQGARAARQRPNANQIHACAQRPRLRREYGAGNLRLQHLERLCRGVGL